MDKVWDWKVEAKIRSIVIHTDSDISFRKTNKILVSASQVMLVIKNPPANARDIRDTGSIPGSGSSPGEGQGNSLQYPCLENSMDSGSWQATVHGVTKSQTRLSTHVHTHTHTGEWIVTEFETLNKNETQKDQGFM